MMSNQELHSLLGEGGSPLEGADDEFEDDKGLMYSMSDDEFDDDKRPERRMPL